MSLRGQTVDDPRDQGWIDMIARYGHAINRVADDVGQPTNEPPFAYSLGAWESYGAPELIVFGLDADLATDIINHVMAEYVAGRRFRCGVPELEVVGNGLPVFFLEADPAIARIFATFTDWYYERQPFPLWQIVWPGKNGRFPWDADYPGNRAWQPDLTATGYGGPSA